MRRRRHGADLGGTTQSVLLVAGRRAGGRWSGSTQRTTPERFGVDTVVGDGKTGRRCAGGRVHTGHGTRGRPMEATRAGRGSWGGNTGSTRTAADRGNSNPCDRTTGSVSAACRAGTLPGRCGTRCTAHAGVCACTARRRDRTACTAFGGVRARRRSCRRSLGTEIGSPGARRATRRRIPRTGCAGARVDTTPHLCILCSWIAHDCVRRCPCLCTQCNSSERARAGTECCCDSHGGCTATAVAHGGKR